MRQRNTATAPIPGTGAGWAFGAWLGRTLLRPIFRVRIAGLENIPRDGSCLIVSNHLCIYDPPIAGSWLPRRCAFAAKRELFDVPLLGWLWHTMGAVPVRRDGTDLTAVRILLRVLHAGGAVMMYPEGTRSRVHTLQPPIAGAAYLAARSGAPVVPLGIHGAERFRLGRWPFNGRVSVNLAYGPPFRLEATGGKIDGADLEQMGHAMMRRIAGLLPSSYRGPYDEVTR